MNENQFAYDHLFKDVRAIISVARSVFEETNELLSLLSDGIDGESPADGSDGSMGLQLDYHFKIGSSLITGDDKLLDGYFTALDLLLEEHPELTHTESTDIPGRLQDMQSNWSKIKLTWPRVDTTPLPTHKELVFELEEVKAAVCELIQQGEIITFPDLVNQQLNDLHTGAYLDFFAAFKNDFDTPERLKDVWTYLQGHSTRINGVLVEPGLIYRASASRMRRILSILYIIGVVGVGALLLLSFHSLGVLPNDKGLQDAGKLHDLFLGYGAILFGGLAHGFVEIYKQYSRDRERTIVLLDNTWLWLHIKEINIVSGIILIWVGYLFYYYISQGIDWQAAFFVGYSIDSFLEIFLSRFTGITSQRLQEATSRSRALSLLPTGESQKASVVGSK